MCCLTNYLTVQETMVRWSLAGDINLSSSKGMSHSSWKSQMLIYTSWSCVVLLHHTHDTQVNVAVSKLAFPSSWYFLFFPSQ